MTAADRGVAEPAPGAGREEAFARCRSASSVPEACSELVDELARTWELPSVYLLVDERLRCMAARGYFQVVDGFTPDTGVIGRVVSSGSVVVVEDVNEDPTFIAAIPGLRAEVCAPVVVAGRAVGAVSLETRSALPVGAKESAIEAAAALTDAIERNGGLPAVPLAQRLARLAVVVSAEADLARLRALTVEAAIQLTGRSGAALSMVTPQGRWAVCATAGPLGQALAEWTEDDLALVARWVAAGTSSHFPGGAPVPPEYEFLLRSGVRTVGVQPLFSGGVLLGMLTVADSEPVAHDATLVATIEILASVAATALRNMALVGDLTDRATRDPLTGLRNPTAFDDDLTSASISAITTGTATHTCMLVDVDHFKSVNDERGHVAGDALLRDLSAAMGDQLRDSDALYRIGGDEFAALVATAEEDQATAIAERLLEAARRVGTTISLGWAAVDRAPVQVRQRADAALYTAKRDGRDVYRAAKDEAP